MTFVHRIFTFIVLALAVTSNFSTVSAASVCEGAFAAREDNSEGPQPFPDYAQVLSARGIEVRSLNVVVEANRQGVARTVRAFYQGKQVGFVSILKTPTLDGDHYGTHSELTPEFIGKGLGSLLYLRAAQALYETKPETGAELGSSFSPSSDAEAVWKGFVVKGWARYYGNPPFPHYSFTPEALKSLSGVSLFSPLEIKKPADL